MACEIFRLSTTHSNTHSHVYRESLAVPTVLNLPKRVDWRECTQSRSEEEKSTQKFREFFKQFDFTNVEDSDSSDSD